MNGCSKMRCPSLSLKCERSLEDANLFHKGLMWALPFEMIGGCIRDVDMFGARLQRGFYQEHAKFFASLDETLLPPSEEPLRIIIEL